jgi:integrase
MNKNVDKAKTEWLNAQKQNTQWQYKARFEIWLQYCKIKKIPSSGSEQLEDIKARRLSNDNTVKYFYDNEVPRFFKWLQSEYKTKKTGKPLSESSALSVCTAIRGFFAYHRYSLEIKKEGLPSSEKVEGTQQDHAFDIYQLRSMFNMGDLRERTILACAKDLMLRIGDFTSLKRDLIELAIKREQELAENETREPDIVEFEILTEKEKEPCSCHLSKETIELLNEYLKTYPKTEKLFPITEDALNDTIKKLAQKSKITLSGKVRFHCLRKFGITIMHGKVTEPVMKYMVGKHISKDLRTYIQNNRETFKAFKLIEPLISLTKTNGNGNMAKQLEEIKKTTAKQLAILKLMEKLTPKEELAKAIEELAKDLNVKLEPKEDVKFSGIPEYDLEDAITKIGEAMLKKDLERILAENGNNNHS